MRITIFASAIFAIGVVFIPGFANAAAVEFFGQDAGVGETSRPATTPEADRARTSFLEEGNTAFIESFERFEDGAYPYRTPDGRWNGGALSFTDGSGDASGAPTATMTTTRGTVVDAPDGTNGYGRYPTDGDKFFHTGAEQISLSFDRPIHGFGFDGIDIGDFRGELTIDIYNGEKLLHAFTLDEVVGGEGGDVLFWGVFDGENPFTTVVFGNSNPLENGEGDVFAMDGLTVVTPVPAALPLLGSGVAALAWMRRRRSQG